MKWQYCQVAFVKLGFTDEKLIFAVYTNGRQRGRVNWWIADSKSSSTALNLFGSIKAGNFLTRLVLSIFKEDPALWNYFIMTFCKQVIMSVTSPYI